MNDQRLPAAPDALVLKNVRIRMYRPGLGDCFLLTFTNKDQQTYHLMIDCGVLPKTDSDPRLTHIVQHILDECNGHIQTVSVTHEHADHISGFTPQNFFWHKENRQVEVDEVWLPWTENAEDDQVKGILQKVETLSMAAVGLALAVDPKTSQDIRNLLLFQGIELDEAVSEFGAAEENQPAAETGAKKKKIYKLKKSLVEYMNTVRRLVHEPLYLDQTKAVDLPKFGVKIYCLGPSRAIPALSGAPESPVAALASQARANTVLAAAAQYAKERLANGADLAADTDSAILAENYRPFDKNKGLALKDLKKCSQAEDKSQFSQEIQDAARFLDQKYGFGEQSSEQGPDWRRIDYDWLRTGGNFALQQIENVNNTSLVLAIELVESHQVLLFVGDAEKGNWHTWKNEQADVKKLLENTVVYKVGHHGSINATDKKVLGETMKNKNLVALMPTDLARAKINDWKFPDPGLYAPQAASETEKGLLYAQTHGRIVLNCIDECHDCGQGPSFDETKAWPGKVCFDQSSEKLWVDYLLEFPMPV